MEGSTEGGDDGDAEECEMDGASLTIGIEMEGTTEDCDNGGDEGRAMDDALLTFGVDDGDGINGIENTGASSSPNDPRAINSPPGDDTL